MASNVERTRNECWVVLIISLPLVIASAVVSENLKKSILDNIKSFIRKKKIKMA